MGTVSTLKSLYTWDRAGFSWDAVQCRESWDSFGIYAHDRSDTQAFRLSDGKRRGIGKHIKESIRLPERLMRELTALTKESLTAQETYWDLISYLLKIVETVKAADYRRADVAQTSSEKASIDDSRTARIRHLTLEQIAGIDWLLRHAEFHHAFAEAWDMLEFQSSHAGTGVNEHVSVEEYRRQDMRQKVSEAADFHELLQRSAVIRRSFVEAIEAAEHYAAHYTGNWRETLAAKDKKFHAANAVLGDVAVKNAAMDLEAFKILVNQPSGYEHFIPYVVGEYEYQKALVRLTVEAGSSGAEPAIYDAVIHVDIDDTVDRGTTAVTDASKAARIYFNKHFYTQPEVTVALYSGNTKDGVVTPNITTIEKDDAGFYFEVELLKESGTRTTGTISWQAVGY